MAADLETGNAEGHDEQFLVDLNRGTELLRSGKADEARELLERACRRRPRDPQGLNQLGLAYFRLGKFDQSRDLFQGLVERFPAEASLRVNLGLAWLRLGDFATAAGTLESALRLEPNHRRANAYLGLAQARMGNHALAAGAFLRAGLDHLALRMEEREFDALDGNSLGELEREVLAVATSPGLVVPGAATPTPPPTRMPRGSGRSPAVPGLDPSAPAEPRAVVATSELETALASLAQEMDEASVPDRAPLVAPAAPPPAAAPPDREDSTPGNELDKAFASLTAEAEIFSQSTEPAKEPPPSTDRTGRGAADKAPPIAGPARAAGEKAAPAAAGLGRGAVEKAPPAAAGLGRGAVEKAPTAAAEPGPAASDGADTLAHTGETIEIDDGVSIVDEGSIAEEHVPTGKPLARIFTPIAWGAAPASGGAAPAAAISTAALVESARAGLPPYLPGAIVAAAMPNAVTLVSVRVFDRAYARASLVVAAEGALSWEPLQRRRMGRPIEETMGGGDPMCRVDGDARLTLSGLGQVLVVLELEDDRLYVRESAVAAIDDRVVWECGVLRGIAKEPEPLLHVRGRGQIVLVLPAPPVAVPVRPVAPTWTAWQHTAGWIGKVVPELALGPLGSEHPNALRFTGAGVVLCHDLGGESGLLR